MLRTTTITTIRAALAAAVTAALGALALAGAAEAQARVKAGTLVCEGGGGWGAIITSRKEFNCTYESASGTVRERYSAVIQKFGLDIGRTDSTVLAWLVAGAEGQVGGNWAPGSLAGTYGGLGADASVGVGIGANAMVGLGESAFILQPLSVQAQTGLNLAAGVQSFTLRYVGPAQ